MIHFQVTKKSSKSHARLGVLKTTHGEVETPAFVPVATAGSIRTITSKEAAEVGSQILIANTFHLHLRPGENTVHDAGGLHEFMQWKRPLMTDSGGFQVFSLGFGRDFGIGKLEKGIRKDSLIEKGAHPKSLKITDDGALFRSPIDGRELFLGPKESIAIQEKIGADIMFAFDECTPSHASREYIKESLKRTHKWAKESLSARKGSQALFGIVQGSHFKDLREESVDIIGNMPFDGFGIGGDLGDIKESKKEMFDILDWTIPSLPQEKPIHLLGIGYIEDMEPIIKKGVDLFDCITPTHYARHGTAFTSDGKLDLGKSQFLKEHTSLDENCSCEVCLTYSRAYISHLIRAKEITGMHLLTLHNLHFFNSHVARIRKKIERGEI